VAGEVVSQFEDPDGDSYDVRLRVERSERAREIDLLGLDLPAQYGRVLVPANQVAYLETGAAPSKTRRRDLLREVRISAGTEGRSLGEVIGDIKQKTAAMLLTLVVVPVVYTLLDDVGERFVKWWTRRNPERARAHVAGD
jgi:HAE1 family hydrophobic/amphiphilic exporter-1